MTSIIVGSSSNLPIALQELLLEYGVSLQVDKKLEQKTRECEELKVKLGNERKVSKQLRAELVELREQNEQLQAKLNEKPDKSYEEMEQRASTYYGEILRLHAVNLEVIRNKDKAELKLAKLKKQLQKNEVPSL